MKGADIGCQECHPALIAVDETVGNAVVDFCQRIKVFFKKHLLFPPGGNNLAADGILWVVFVDESKKIAGNFQRQGCRIIRVEQPFILGER